MTALSDKYCYGFTPPALNTFSWEVDGQQYIGVSPEDFDAAGPWVRAYIRARNAQYNLMCPQ